MNIFSISWVRNEGDIIEAFVRHHCAMLDRMIIIDHHSSDDTPKILQSLKDEGLPIEILHDNSPTHRQGEALTFQMYSLLERADAPDWILPLDADEFVCSSGAGLRETLEASNPQEVLLLPWRTYVPTVNDRMDELHVLRRIRHRRSSEHPVWHKICIPAGLPRATAYHIPMGSHSLLQPGGEKSPMKESASLSLAHFPVRDINQIRCKVAGHWLRHRSHAKFLPGTCYQWQALYESMKRGDVWDAMMLQHIGMTYGTSAQWKELEELIASNHPFDAYLTIPSPDSGDAISLVEDPISSNVTLQYNHVPLNPLRVLAETAEEIAASHAVLAKKLEEQR